MSWHAIVRRRTGILLPFGFYGWGNIGDESTLQGFARLVGSCGGRARVWVASRNPAHTYRVEPAFSYYHAEKDSWRGRWFRHRADACVVAGGTPIMDVLGEWPLSEVVPLAEQAWTRRKPVVFVGTGTETLQREESRRIMSERLAPIVERWSVRSERDRERLVEYGIEAGRVEVAGDLAWLLDKQSTVSGVECLGRLGLDPVAAYVGVNLTNERFVAKQQPRLFEEIAEALDRLIEEQDVRVLFLSNEVREHETLDKAASERVLAHMRRRDRATLVPNEYRSPAEMLSLIGCCRVTIGMRYHFCLFSALQDVPFVGVKRSDKVADLCWDLRWSHALGLEELTGAALFDMARDLARGRDGSTAALGLGVQAMKRRAWRNRSVVEGVLGGAPGATVGALTSSLRDA